MRQAWRVMIVAATLGWGTAAAAAGPPAASAGSATPPAALAQQIIKAAGAGDLFMPVDAGEEATIRHRRSGLVCVFFPGGDLNALHVTGKSGLPRGDDITCDTNIQNLNLYTFGAHYGPEVTVDSQMARLNGDVAKLLEGGTAQPGPTLDGDQPMRSSAITGSMGGQPYDSFAVVGQVSGWTFTLLCIAPPSADAVCRRLLAGLTQAELRSMLAATAGGKPAK